MTDAERWEMVLQEGIAFLRAFANALAASFASLPSQPAPGRPAGQAAGAGESRPIVDHPPVATAPASPPAAPARFSRREAVWTPERVALLRELWPSPAPSDEIRSGLEGLPGAAIGITLRAITWKAYSLGLKRPASSRGTPWTAERDACLARVWPTGMPLAEVEAMLAALPGIPIGTNGAVRARAIALGIPRTKHAAPRKPVPLTPASPAPAAARSPAPAVPQADDLPVVAVAAATIRAFAEKNDLPYSGTSAELRRINGFRARKGLAQWMVAPSRGRLALVGTL